MTAPMPETMSPREKVAAAINEFVFQAHNGRLSGVDLATDAILAALASSGDHAELARLAEWRDRLRADPGRAAHFGSPYADKPMHNGRTYWNSDLADDITALIAEVAALRGERDAYFGMANRSEDAWLKAERKLAEAMGLHDRHPAAMRKIYPSVQREFEKDIDSVRRTDDFLSLPPAPGAEA